ncbi:MAG: radical SAM family heme chaperone HemW [Burkholderiaceae bacterium]|nr:radical SAM family heme chaperone HemW [Burkholderiaceae bacterium]
MPIIEQGSAKTGFARASGQRLTSLPPLSLYIHVPWCVRKCPYCDFNSHQAPQVLPEADYIAALTADIEQALPLVWGRHIHTVFIGGGTPSLLSEGAVEQMLGIVRARLNLWPDAEITLEANPGTAEADRFKSYAASGVNRISLGVQSFDNDHLERLGRIHDSAQAMAAIEMAQKAVNRVNLDLMYGLPSQTLDQCRLDLQRAVSFNTEHLSLYQLTLEPQTVFSKYPPVLPAEDIIEQMESLIVEVVEKAGWKRYEVSAYARRGAQCRHNLNYWTFGDYLGVGPGAHSKISFPDRIIRQARTRNPQQWMQTAITFTGSHVAEQRELGDDDLPFEFFLNALRLREGVELSLFREHTGMSLADIASMIKIAQQKQLLVVSSGRIQPTELGWQHLNELQTIFLR